MSALLAQLDLTMLDGIRDFRCRWHENWKFSTGPITGVGIYEGETYYVRLPISTGGAGRDLTTAPGEPR